MLLLLIHRMYQSLEFLKGSYVSRVSHDHTLAQYRPPSERGPIVIANLVAVKVKHSKQWQYFGYLGYEYHVNFNFEFFLFINFSDMNVIWFDVVDNFLDLCGILWHVYTSNLLGPRMWIWTQIGWYHISRQSPRCGNLC